MLHFKPREIVMLGSFAIVSNIHLRLRKAENLFAIKKLLLGRVIQRGLRSAGILTLRSNRDTGKCHGQKRIYEHLHLRDLPRILSRQPVGEQHKPPLNIDLKRALCLN